MAARGLSSHHLASRAPTRPVEDDTDDDEDDRGGGDIGGGGGGGSSDDGGDESSSNNSGENESVGFGDSIYMRLLRGVSFTKPLTLLANLTTFSFVVSDNVTSSLSPSMSVMDFDDILNGSNYTTVTSSNNVTEAPPFKLPHSVWLTVVLGLLAGVLVILTILGNITVLLAFGLERTIRQPTNYFLASLAVSDLLIGTFSMPLYTVYLLIGVWPLGDWLCDLWLSLDFSVCLTSQYTVFLITMDRYLSVKIPAKYRNWRTENKVLIMIIVTWVLPALVFFTSIIGWQFFVGKRTVPEGACAVQFMSDAMFTFALTIGYFWITLIIIGILYAAIYAVALDLQRKSDAKHKKLQSTMELAGDGSNRGNNNALRNAEGVGGGGGGGGGGGAGSNNNSSGGDSNAPTNKANNKSGGKANNRKSVRAALPCPIGAAPMNTTSFSTNKAAEKDDDRSSSPAFASDDENSSSGGAIGAPKSPMASGVYIGRPNPAAGIVNSALFANTGGLVRSLHGDLFFGGAVEQRQEQQQVVQPSGLPPPYAEVAGVQNAGTGVDAHDGSGGKLSKKNGGGEEDPDDLQYSSASEKQTTPLLKEEINKGSRYIDEQSFLANLNSESTALLPDIYKDASEVEDNSDVNDARTASSPIWKRRHSLPLDSYDDYDDYDDEVSEFITGDPTTTLTSVMDPSDAARYDDVYAGNNLVDIDDKGYDADDNDKEIARISGNVSGGGCGGGGDGKGNGGTTANTTPTTHHKTNVVSFDNANHSDCKVPQQQLQSPTTGNNHISQTYSGDQQQQRSTTTTFPNTTTTTTTNNNNTSLSSPAAAAAAGITTTTTPTTTTTLPTASPCNNAINNNNTAPQPQSDANDESSRSDIHCLSTAHRRRNNNDTRLHTFVKSVRSRNSRRRNRRERKSKSENRARKALRTITIILGAFVLCWTPYHICVMVMALCSDCIHDKLFAFTYWMCYLNSPINPFCYAFANAQFKRTFLRILRFDWHRT